MGGDRADRIEVDPSAEHPGVDGPPGARRITWVVTRTTGTSVSSMAQSSSLSSSSAAAAAAREASRGSVGSVNCTSMPTAAAPWASRRRIALP